MAIFDKLSRIPFSFLISIGAIVLWLARAFSEIKKIGSFVNWLSNELSSLDVWLLVAILLLAAIACFDTIRPYVDLFYEKTRKRTLLKKLAELLIQADDLVTRHVDDGIYEFHKYMAAAEKWKADVAAALNDECFAGLLGVFESFSEAEWEAATRIFLEKRPSEGLSANIRALLEIRRNTLKKILEDHSGS